MSDTAPQARTLAVVERAPRELFNVILFGNAYLIKHREDLGFGALARLDGILAGYGHLMSMAAGGKLDQMTDEEADSLETPMRQLVATFLDGVEPDVVARLTPMDLVTVVLSFGEALGNRAGTPTPTNRAPAPGDQSPGNRSSRRSSASTAATPARGRATSRTRSRSA